MKKITHNVSKYFLSFVRIHLHKYDKWVRKVSITSSVLAKNVRYKTG